MATDSEATAVDVGVSDDELFQSAFADEPAETPAAEATTENTATDGPNRDEQGRFAAKEDKTEQPAPEQATAAAPKDAANEEGQVPSWRVREINEEKRVALARAEAAERERSDLKSRLDALERQQRQPQPTEQPKQERPDPILDPDGYDKWVMDRFEAKNRETTLNVSMALAHNKHGETFEKAYNALVAQKNAGNMQLVSQLTSHPNPGEAVVKWWRDQETLREVGGDPAAYKNKLLEDALNDQAFLAKAIERAKGAAAPANPATQKPNVQLPPSLSNMSRADSGRGDDETDLSDEALFRYATR